MYVPTDTIIKFFSTLGHDQANLNLSRIFVVVWLLIDFALGFFYIQWTTKPFKVEFWQE